MNAGSGDFDTAALYRAIEDHRLARGVTWAEVARDINSLFRDASSSPISVTTLRSLQTRTVVEGDGVLQVLRWLDAAPERFMPGTTRSEALPHARADQLLRFDTQRVYVALDARRHERGISWKQVAYEIPGTSASSLTRLAHGGRTSFPQIGRIAQWLERTIASLVRVTDR